jgi:hypothetical protein
MDPWRLPGLRLGRVAELPCTLEGRTDFQTRLGTGNELSCTLEEAKPTFTRSPPSFSFACLCLTPREQ